MGRGGPQHRLEPNTTILLCLVRIQPESESLSYLEFYHLKMTSTVDDYDDKLADLDREARNKEIRAREQQEQAGMHS